MTADVPALVDVSSFASIYPFAPRFLATPAGRLAYVDEGPRVAEDVLLMLHGNPTWSFYYRRLIQAFSDSHRVVAPDHLGCGQSDKPDDFPYRLSDHIDNLERLVDGLSLRSVSLVVHDWGGAIGMGLAVRRPELVRRLVILNTAAFPADRIPFSINICRLPGFGALAIRGFNAFAQVALLRCCVHRERLTPAVRRGYLAPYDSWANRVANLRFVQDIPMKSSHPSYALLEHIGAEIAQFKDRPMLIAWGGQDFCFNDLFYEEWKRRFPDAVAIRFEDAGHFVLEDAHERVIPAMRTLLRKPV